MTIVDRSNFIKKQASEKISLAHVNGRKRLYTFTGPTLNIYSKTVPYFVSKLKQDDIELIKVNDLGSVVAGTFYYDIKTSVLHVRFIGDADPTTIEAIVTYTLFFSEKGVSLPHDLQDVSDDVYYEGRIMSSPAYKHKIGIDQALTSLVGEGNLKLRNQDGGLDDVFDTLIFENKEVVIYSWSPQLKPSDARVIYRGRVTNKTYNDGIDVTFKIKDQVFDLLDSPDLEQYTADDNVSESVQGQFKRRIYGRVDGVKCQSISQVSTGFELTGTGTSIPNSNVLTGTGTTFLSEVLQGDTVIIGTQEFQVDRVIDNLTITLSDETEFGFTNQPIILRPSRGSSLKNREYLAAGHICAEVTHTIADFFQFNRLRLDSTEGLFAGDFIEFTETAERIEIKTVAPGNIIVLQQSVIQKATNGTTVVRRPIQEVYINSRRVNTDDFTINNTSSVCGLTFDNDVEFNLTFSKNTKFTGTFTNGSRVVNITTTELSLADVFRPGDFVKPDDLTYTTFYKIVNVNSDNLELDQNFTDPTISDVIELKSVEYLDDETVVSVNMLGRTVDGTSAGIWIQNYSQVALDLLKDVGITTVNSQSFVDGEQDSPQLISYAIPEDINSTVPPVVKDIIDNLNKSTNSSLTLDNDLLIKFKTLNVFTGEEIPVIRDFDVIDWKIKSTNGKTYRKIFSRYQFKDVDLSTLQPGNKTFSFDNEFVKRYIETNKVDDLDLYLYNELDAEIATHRYSYLNQLGTATLTIMTDLRLENNEIGEVVIVDFQRLYKRYGNSAHRKKVMLITGKELNGQRTKLILSDLGNTFNTSSYITPGTAPDYDVATDDDKLIYGYITNGQGIVDDDEDTAGVHLIS